MTRSLFVKMLEHNNWANQVLLEACARLTNEVLDAIPDALLGT